MHTWMLPEKSTWKITTLKGKTVCNGGHYAQWYMSYKVNCKLAYKREYRIQCRNTPVGGWAGGYLTVGKKHLCHKYTFDRGPVYTQTFTAE